MNFNRKAFFDSYRAAFGKLSQEQVNGLSFLLSAISADATWKNLNQVAYFLATIDHETAHTFQPIKEKRERADSPRRKNQDRYWKTGYYGRGYIQLTWLDNYIKFGLGSIPDKALEPETAYRIAARGMQQGLFTGQKLSTYINGTKTDYVNARRVVNGLDRANLIAKNARAFESILEASEVPDGVYFPDSETVEIPVDDTPDITVADDVADDQPQPTPAVVVTAEQPKETNPKEQASVSGPKSWIAALTTFATTAGAGALSWINGASKEIVIGFFGAASIVGVVYFVSRYWYRNKENQRLAEVQLAREKMAHELTLLKMKSAMDKNSLTVEVSHE